MRVEPADDHRDLGEAEDRPFLRWGGSDCDRHDGSPGTIAATIYSKWWMFEAADPAAEGPRVETDAPNHAD